MIARECACCAVEIFEFMVNWLGDLLIFWYGYAFSHGFENLLGAHVTTSLVDFLCLIDVSHSLRE